MISITLSCKYIIKRLALGSQAFRLFESFSCEILCIYLSLFLCLHFFTAEEGEHISDLVQLNMTSIGNFVLTSSFMLSESMWILLVLGTLNPKVILELFAMYRDWQEEKAQKIANTQVCILSIINLYVCNSSISGQDVQSIMLNETSICRSFTKERILYIIIYHHIKHLV